ncbi:MAG: DUF6807 family protein [Verrucomicrobiia bacterium]
MNRMMKMAAGRVAVACLLALVAGQTAALRARADASPTTQSARILLVTGNDYPGHLWRETAPALKRALEGDPRLRVEVMEDAHQLASLKAQDWDAVVLHYMNWESPSPGEQARENLRRFVRDGKGLMLVHFACGAWQDWPEFKNLAGRVWDPKLRGHDPHGTFRVEITDADHPITKGMKPFDTTDELYTCLTGDRPIHVIASARSKVDQKVYPMAFVFEYGQGRVFHSVLGHDVRAITNSAVPELFQRGCAWVARLPVGSDTALRATADRESGQFMITENGRPVLRYNYQTVQPGDLLSKVQPGNLIYARPRSDYIHPLYGLDGQELTYDWSLDHPHHRGIYWAWPEVDYRGERGDLHALQRVFARPTGKISLTEGPDFAQITAENQWLWEDKEPIVREQTVIRTFTSSGDKRRIVLEFTFTALGDDVALARRGTEHYGGLNLRFTKVEGQRITIPPGEKPGWADISGVFGKGSPPTGVTIVQDPRNPQYPGDWIQYPDLNWLQPTFPGLGKRWVLKKNEPLILRFELWIHRGTQPVHEHTS